MEVAGFWEKKSVLFHPLHNDIIIMMIISIRHVQSQVHIKDKTLKKLQIYFCIDNFLINAKLLYKNFVYLYINIILLSLNVLEINNFFPFFHFEMDLLNYVYMESSSLKMSAKALKRSNYLLSFTSARRILINHLMYWFTGVLFYSMTKTLYIVTETIW